MQASVYETNKNVAQVSIEFERKLQPLRKRIYKLAYRNLRNREDAEDITQETFVRAWMHYARFNTGRSFDAWVTRIAINLCLDTIRRRRHRTTSLDSDREECLVTDSPQEPLKRLLNAERGESLEWALYTLPTPYRCCVELLAQQHSYAEVSALLGCPIGTIRSRLHRARALIRKRLETL